MRQDSGLLLLRLGIGAMFVAHGVPKVLGGPDRWEKLGGAMETFGIHFAPQLWGFAAALSESAGGLLLAMGLAFRPACTMLLSTMVVAAAMHLDRGDGWAKASHAIESAILFASLLWMGPGAYVLTLRHRGRP